MDKASKAIRRSGVRLKSMSGGHGALQMVISQLGEVRTSLKAFTQAQATASEDTMRWAAAHENRAIAETFSHLAELSLVWTDVQRDFAERLKEYRSQYELVLEGEKHVTLARETLASREQREAKLRKELKKAGKKAPAEEIRLLREKLSQAERSRDLSHLEVMERVAENEAVKMIRVKEGLLKVGAAYCELAQKCLMIFTAHMNVASELPDVHDRDLHDVKYTGAGAAKKFVQQAKEQVRAYRQDSLSHKPPLPEDPPPPYTPSVEHLNDLSAITNHNGTNDSSGFNLNNSSLNPSAPRASLSSLSPPKPEPRSGGHGKRNQPTGPGASNANFDAPPQYPAAGHAYPDLQDFPAIDIPNSPSHMNPQPPTAPVHPTSPHSTSAPNLANDTPTHHGVKYPPLNVGDNSSYNDTCYQPDTSSSSPNLSSHRHSSMTSPENSNPFNPYYDWLPDRNGKKKKEEEDTSGFQTSTPRNTSNAEEGQENQESRPNPPSVRPRTGRNPFLEDYSDDDDINDCDQGEESLSGALRKSSIR